MSEYNVLTHLVWIYYTLVWPSVSQLLSTFGCSARAL